MIFKASLHNHTSEDIADGRAISYNVFGLIDHAGTLGFKILAITTHWKCVVKEEHCQYASEKNILLLPGVELDINRIFIFHQDVVLICPSLDNIREAELIKNYNDLKNFREKYPDIYVLAAHPNFGRVDSMGCHNLVKNIDLFDGIECSWFYSRRFDLNKKSQKIASKYNKPIIATADAHALDFFNTDYCDIESKSLEVSDIFNALKMGSVTNHSQPKKIRDLVRVFGKMILKKIF